MRALDTNVLARWVLNDDPVQSPVAAIAVGEPFLVHWTVFTELGWVLEKAIGLQRPIVASLLEQLISLETAFTENSAALAWALVQYRAGADWADMMHLASASIDATSFVTFDLRLERQAGEKSPLPIATLRTNP